MIRLSRWCFEHRRRVVAGWLLALVAVLGLSQALGSEFSSDFSLPGTDSQAAVTLLAKNFPAASGEGDQVVIQATHGATIRSASVRGGGDRGAGQGGRGARRAGRRQPLQQPGPAPDQPGRHGRLRHA